MDDQHTIDLELVESIDVERGLSEWEAEFVDSLLIRLRGSSAAMLTERQRVVAQRIQKRLDGEARG